RGEDRDRASRAHDLVRELDLPGLLPDAPARRPRAEVPLLNALDERRWIFGGGLTPEWSWVVRRRRELALEALARVEKAYLKGAPPLVRAKRYAAGLRYFLKTKGPERDRLAVHPCFDYWLDLHARHFSNPAQEHDWHLQFGLFQSFP